MHRAESILNAFTTALIGLSTTDANVVRGRIWAVEFSPSLTIYKGADVASENSDVLDTLARDLSISVEIHVNATGNPESALNQIAAEVYAAINADVTLGLDYVYDCIFFGDDAPEMEPSQDLPVARMISQWVVEYDHSKGSAEA
jgi:hypothetical protein